VGFHGSSHGGVDDPVRADAYFCCRVEMNLANEDVSP
jgi:hypothetical protein